MKTNLKLISLSVVAAIALSACGNNNTAQQTTTEPAPATAAPADSAPAATEQVAINITGAGASFPQPIYAKWSEDFRAATGGQVNYQSIGSSGRG